ncbi:thioredoxin-dependent thiol peroxidase [Crocosphaera sp. UHCC 0190]|uniref:thioredoxin-dependent thiol peroxidase n=1 Tax=Crocosphaera sp. UHCC 0190 TaxID=3110246 RepID=UPI002B1F66FC|nr:thioredoxin-dependent thiol peroxidase [Crocosphaera sp. UHCC 0190]MEA5509282.1 thioredoxin-dependent thiol peroxidase [Crocosphaera sp. UHCC 0190]
MSKLLEIGQPASNFTINNQDGKAVNLNGFLGQWLVLYFYPKDNTPGCTTEAQDFSKLTPEFEALGAKIIGISPDSEKSHCKFIAKHQLSLELLCDSDHQVAESYGVWGLKKFMGKEYMGIIRSTFIINPEQNIAYIWSNVRVKNHAETVLKKLRELQS